MKKYLLAILFVALKLSATTAVAPLCTFTAVPLAGVQAACTNSNSATPSTIVFTLDGSTPTSNGSGTGAGNGVVLAPVASGGASYTGYFSFYNTPIAVKAIAGVAGETDSAVTTYTPTVATQLVLAAGFSMQCGPGMATNCQIVSGAISWPTSVSTPKGFRIHDAGQGWSSIEPSCTTFSGALCVSPNFNWSIVDKELDGIVNHSEYGMYQLLSTPCWLQVSCDVADAVYPNGGNAPPTDLGSGPMGSSPNFNAFITALIGHTTANGNTFISAIKAIQAWNEWDLGVHWTGTIAQLYSLLYYPMTQIVRPAMPGVIIWAPSVQFEGTNNQSGNAITDLTNWLIYENAHGRFSDGPDWHAYLTLTSSTTNTPEAQFAAWVVGYLNAISALQGWAYAPTINGETNFNAALNYTCPSSEYPQPGDCPGQIARWEILLRSNGVSLVSWYYWNQTIGDNPVYSQVFGSVENWLENGNFTAAASVTSNIWTVPFHETNGLTALMAWTPSESGLNYTVPSGYTDYKTLTGATVNVTAGNSITLTTQPIMLEQNPAILAPSPATGLIAVIAEFIYDGPK
jgi:hypothetical protein